MYIEGDVPQVVNGNNGYGFGGSWEGLIGLIAVAALFGGGYGFGGGFGFGGRNGGAGSELLGYELGKVATTNDVASGFNNSAVLSSLNDIKLGQANAINYNNQGFAGLNTSMLTGFHSVGNAISNLGYQMASCCCDLKGAIADVKYADERNTCQIINAINAGNQQLISMYTNDKIDTLNRKLASAEAQLSNQAQSAYIVNQLKQPCPIPSYIVPNPNCCYVIPTTPTTPTTTTTA